jgi:hypothetical protein
MPRQQFGLQPGVEATSLAFDESQGLLAVGLSDGSIILHGRNNLEERLVSPSNSNSAFLPLRSPNSHSSSRIHPTVKKSESETSPISVSQNQVSHLAFKTGDKYLVSLSHSDRV